MKRPAVLYLQGELEVSQAGPIAIDIATDQQTHVWLDAEPFESSKHLERVLEPLRHAVTLRIELSATEDPQLKVEVTRPANSAAQFVIVAGM